MNLNSEVSRPVAVDLSADAAEFMAVTLRSNGLDKCGAQDIMIGTLLRGNVAASNGQSIPSTFQPAADFVLRGGAVVTFVQLGNNSAAISMGDLLTIDPSNPGLFLNAPKVAITSGVASTGVWTKAGHALSVGEAVRLTDFTGATDGLTAGAIYYVNTVPDANTFTLAASPGGATVTWTTNATGANYQLLPQQPAPLVIAWDSCPSGQTGGRIRAVVIG